MNLFIDAHAHLTSRECVGRLPEMVEKAAKVGIAKIVNVCTDLTSLQEGLKYSKEFPWIYNAAATPPHDVEEDGESHFPIFERAAKEGKLIALGETGLDHLQKNRSLQREFLSRYLFLSLELHLPLIFHCREEFDDLFAITKGKNARCMIHCFTGTYEDAKEAISRGWYISLSGVITFKKSEELRAIVKKIPLEHILIETDTPYLAPQSRRGKPNEPAFIKETAEMIAHLKEISIDEVAFITSNNAEQFFSFSNFPSQGKTHL